MIPNIFIFALNNKPRMIQRIQTLYLLIADFLVAILFFFPLSELADKEGIIYQYNIFGVIKEGVDGAVTQSSWPGFALVCLILFLLTSIIFQFRNRSRQIKLCYVAISLLLGLTAYFYFYTGQISTSFGGSYSLKVFFSFPLVAAGYVFLAIRGIAKDENLVKSIDRIR
jgi:hypothetical protein